MNNLHDLLILSGYAILCWFAYFILWRRVRRESFQQELFHLRDQLFDAATLYQIPYHHPAYYTLRRRLHGFIRHPERATYLHGLICRIWHEDSDPLPEQSERSFQHALETLTHPQARVVFSSIATELNLSLRRQVISHSILLYSLHGLMLAGSRVSSSLLSFTTIRLPSWLNLGYLTEMAEQTHPG